MHTNGAHILLADAQSEPARPIAASIVESAWNLPCRIRPMDAIADILLATAIDGACLIAPTMAPCARAGAASASVEKPVVEIPLRHRSWHKGHDVDA